MRILTEIDDQQAAEKLVAYLLTQKIDTHIERTQPAQNRWEIWVREEDNLHRAKQELTDFLENPQGEKYTKALTEAQRIIDERIKSRQQAAKQIQKVESRGPGRLGGPAGGIPPLTLTLMIVCILIGLMTNFGQPRNSKFGRQVMDTLGFVSDEDYAKSGQDPAASLKKGEVWRAITPTVVHLDVLHLAINLFIFVSLGRIVERWIGTPKFALLVLTLAIVPNLFQGLAPDWLQGSPFFGGISGVVYGLFGYVWIRSSINPSHGISVPFPMIVILIAIIVIGLSDVIPDWRMADLCHLGGLLVGSAFGFASEQT